jgi:inner membrane protease subunit 1
MQRVFLARQASSSPTWPETTWFLVTFASLVYVSHEYLLDVTLTQGSSMMPTLSLTGDIVLVDRTLKVLPWRDYRVGDVIVAKSMTQPREFVCKRIMALPDHKNSAFGRRVPKGYVWIEGDNKPSSVDSRDYGPIPQAMLEGRVLFRIWPPSKFGGLRNHVS